jgi:hypothetical protein
VRVGLAVVSSGTVSGASQGAKRRDCFAKRNQTLRDDGRKSLKSLGVKSSRFAESCLFNTLIAILLRASTCETVAVPSLIAGRSPPSAPLPSLTVEVRIIRKISRE